LREGGNQITTTTMTDHAKAIQDYSADSLLLIGRDLQKIRSRDKWENDRLAAIKAALKKKGVVLS